MNQQRTKFLGRIFLRRSKSGSIGLKVIGGRRNKDGTLGAYVTKVMPGSPADYVGQLKPAVLNMVDPQFYLHAIHFGKLLKWYCSVEDLCLDGHALIGCPLESVHSSYDLTTL
uniref:PDZ domain-containing protein n=1 Tax=Romanomermis culicivorax TaxID=13658 RepID=A0A915IMJ4_ROMCU